MSYEPSHRKPPHQERWPNATPGEGWPAFQQGDGGRARESAFAGSRNGYGDHASNGYGDAWGSRGATAGGYGGAWDGQGGAWDGQGGAWDGQGGAWDGQGGAWDGQGGARYDDGRRGAAGYRDPGQGYRAAGDGYGGTTNGYPAVGDGYADGFDGAADGYVDGYAGAAADGYGGPEDYYETPNGYDDGWDGYSQAGNEFTSPADYPEQHGFDPAASSVLVAPDTIGEWWRPADRDDGLGQDQDRGLVVSAVTGVLAAAVAIGVATLAAAFVRPQASPVSAVGGVFIDRIPATLRSHLVAHFGAHGQTVLLLGALGFIAVVLGCLARRNASIGVAGIAAFGLLGAFVAITRPESRASDVIPSALGGLAGIMAMLWLARASAPVASLRPASSGGRRRAR
jgi:hypothetical protein